MRKLHSGMDAWRYLVRSQPQRKRLETYLPLILSAAGALGVLPFTILRFMQGNWVAAIVDTLIVIGFIALGTYVYQTRRVRFASLAISVLCMGGVMTTVYVNGAQQVYWAFPALMAVFYLVRPSEAVVGVVITIVAILPVLLPGKDTHETTTILITIVVMSAFAYAFSLITDRQREQLLQLATKDPLTGAGNRRGLDTKLRDVVNTFNRSNSPASLVLIDLDHFKAVNDIHGHAVGDQILKSITEIVNLRIRVTDSLYRIGGEEFVVVLEGADLHRAAHLAEQLRTLVDANELVPDHAVTISLGVAELKSGESPNDWLHRADEALYRAKDAGRNSTSLSD
ncbi:MAG: GGDEF domain-containing protein [Woeseiaceae bacterium]|nr:GGDEF domain-containing protein [Woeseiaceae bacterium]